MDNRRLIIIGAVVLLAMVAFELYADYFITYTEYKPNALTNLNVGPLQLTDYYKDGENIGTYTSTVEVKNQTLGEITYTISSKTDLIYQEKHQTVDTILTITDRMRLLDYKVSASINDISSTTTVTMKGSNANVTNTFMGDTITLNVNVPENTIVMDHSQPAHWELLVRSFNFELGKRYRVNVFIPQTASIHSWELGADQNLQTISIGGVSYTCLVVRQADMDIQFYVSNGALIRYRDQINNIVIEKKPG